MRRIFFFLILCVILAGILTFSGCSKPEYSEFIDTVASPVRPVVGKVKIGVRYFHDKVAYKTKTFYEANNYKKVWLEQKGPNKQYKAFVNEVMESYRYGINPEDYRIPELEKEVEALYENKKRTEVQMSELDIRITASFFHFTTHLLEGRIRRAGAPDFIWKKGIPKEDDVSLLLSMNSANDLRREIDKLHPKDPQYEKLRKAFKEYKDLAQADNFPKIAIRKPIKPADSHQVIPVIRKKLKLTDLESDREPEDSLTYDEKLVDAVKQFQKRHGLTSDGIIDQETVKNLNVSLQQKTEVIALNLERLRWRPHLDLQNEQLIVNIPEYMLRVYNNKNVKMEMKVILGSDFNATPIFYDTLKYIVFSPTWNVPKSILEEEFLPNLKNNPAYYSTDFKFFKNGVEVDPEEEDWNDEELDVRSYQVVQNPGNLNALGHVKFVMPNNFNIYLHDTPADRLFRREDRALSHGCIRLEKPVDLATYLLEDQQNWNKDKVTEAMSEGEPKTIRLKKPFPVNIVYRTAWVDDDGLVNFREDIYGHDARQLAQLKKSGDFNGVVSAE
jgi:L,D-transpeptidase YcbB